MAEFGHILIADDEAAFRESMADLLRRKGYECTCVADAQAATEMLRGGGYDLLIADINMPGNVGLEFVRELPRIAEGVPVILVTGYPSLDSAIESVHLPVAAYFIKPIDFEELAAQVKLSISNFQVYHAVREAQHRLDAWRREVDSIAESVKATHGTAAPVNVNAFLVLTLRHIIDALLDLKNMAEAVTLRHGVQAACQLYECPRLAALVDSLKESIDVLERTKGAFKSRQLGDLRRKLEEIVETATTPGPAALAPGRSPDVASPTPQ